MKRILLGGAVLACAWAVAAQPFGRGVVAAGQPAAPASESPEQRRAALRSTLKGQNSARPDAQRASAEPAAHHLSAQQRAELRQQLRAQRQQDKRP